MLGFWTAAAGGTWSASSGRAVPTGALLHLVSGLAASYMLAERPDVVLGHGAWGGSSATCVAAGPDGAAQLVSLLAEEGESEELPVVVGADLNASSLQMLVAAMLGAGVHCRLIALGFTDESEAWYGRPVAAAVIAARLWGGKGGATD